MSLRTNPWYRGEQTATNLEASLTRLENTLDQLLASMEEEGNEVVVDNKEVQGQANDNSAGQDKDEKK